MGTLFSNFKWTQTRLLELGLACFLLGIFLVRFGWVTNWQLVLASLFCFILVILKSRWAFLAVAALALNLGIFRGQITYQGFSPLFEKHNQNVHIVGEVQDDPGLADRYQTEFHLTNLQLFDGDTSKPIGGRITVRGFSDTKINRHDIVDINGKLRPALGNNQGQINFAKILVIGRRDTWIGSLRRRFIAGAYSSLAEPAASLGLGFLIGVRSLLPRQLEQQLTITGLTHIVAVSGYNLTILIRFARRLLASYSKYLATIVSFGLMVGFIIATGLSPSIFRAAIISSLALGAWYYGRTIKPLMLILVAASITVGINPAYVWYDIGWYLSFLAFYGVLVVGPIITARIYKKNKPLALTQLFIESFAAQIMVVPIISFIFGKISLVSLVANVVVLPLIPLAMITTFIAGLGGMLTPSISGWFSWPAQLVLNLIIDTISWFAALPWASRDIKITAGQLVLLYTIIMGFIFSAYRNSKQYLKNSIYSVVE